jgi:hypothetical protein
MLVVTEAEELRKMIREETETAVKRSLVTVHASPTGSADPEAILTYEDAAALVGRKPDTIRAWTVRRKGQQPRLRRYKCGRAAGVKRGELLAAWQSEGAADVGEGMSADDEAEAIVSGKVKRGKR